MYIIHLQLYVIHVHGIHLQDIRHVTVAYIDNSLLLFMYVHYSPTG